MHLCISLLFQALNTPHCKHVHNKPSTPRCPNPLPAYSPHLVMTAMLSIWKRTTGSVTIAAFSIYRYQCNVLIYARKVSLRILRCSTLCSILCIPAAFFCWMTSLNVEPCVQSHDRPQVLNDSRLVQLAPEQLHMCTGMTSSAIF